MKQIDASSLTVAMARYVLRYLVGLPTENGSINSAHIPTLAIWLTKRELGPIARIRLGQFQPELAQRLQIDTISAVAEMSLHLRNLKQIKKSFATKKIPLALLKGAALAQTVYENPAWRIMSDIDLWVQTADVPRATAALTALGYHQIQINVERPFALQQLSKGEIQFTQSNTAWGLIELHWSPLSGWWLQRTAAIDETAVWSRKQLLPDEQAYQLTAEDTLIQSAIHMGVNHQFDILATRHLLDMALTVQKRGVDWQLVVERAQEWRVATAVYTALNLLNQLIGLENGLDEAVRQLQPSPLRQRLLRRYVTAESIVAGRELRYGRSRYIFLLLLVDRRRDMIKLIYRTIWPEQSWLQARYGKAVSNVYHLKQLIQHGNI